MEDSLLNIQELFLCDETKFNISNGNIEDATYYFGVSVNKKIIKKIDTEIKEILKKYRVKTEIFHSTNIFRETRPRIDLMNDLCKIIIDNKLHCYCYKYEKSNLYSITKPLNKFNNELINFDKADFQALFYFIAILNTHLIKIGFPEKQVALYFDRNIYGIKETENFIFDSNDLIIKRMTFIEKSNINLLCLPDLLGYIFRKSKLSQDKADSGNVSLETSKLSLGCYKNYLQIFDQKLFHLIGNNLDVIEGAVKSLLK